MIDLSIGEVADVLGAQIKGDVGLVTTLAFPSVSIDSRTIQKGECFIAFEGERFNGHNFIDEALEKGASVVVLSQNSAVHSNWQDRLFLEVNDTDVQSVVLMWASQTGKTEVINNLAGVLVGEDPRPIESHVARMYAIRRQASGGIAQQAIGAIENALLDLKAKGLGIPVYEMLGGPVRERIRLYWSHCGTYQLSFAEEMQITPLRSLDDVVELGRQAASSGYSALKTNVFRFDDGEASLHSPGFWQGEGYPELNADRAVIRAMCEQLEAFREGTGPDIDILVDLNFNFKTEGFLKLSLIHI